MIATGETRVCPVCSSAHNDEVFALNPTPLGDALCGSKTEALGLPRYPLSLVMCEACSHVFVPKVVPPRESYSNYFFSSSKSPGLSDVMEAMARDLWSVSAGKIGELVVDLGSNDGTFLAAFKALGATVQGVEPSDRQSLIANSIGIPTLNEYFDHTVVDWIRSEIGNPHIITIHNVLANLPDPGRFLKDVRMLASPDTLISVVTGYHPDQFAVNMIDYVYHEHLSHFTATDFRALAANSGLDVVGVRRIPLKGGSLQLFLRPSLGVEHHSSDFMNLLAWETWRSIRSRVFFQELRGRLDANGTWLDEFLSTNDAEKVYGYGCSHSVTTLMYLFSLAPALAGLVDDNQDRQGLYAPGTGLEILGPEVLRDTNHSVLILAWQHDWRIMNQLRDLNHNGLIAQFMPHPTIRQRGRR